MIVIFVADFIFSLSRTPQDKQANTGRVFIAKNRNGAPSPTNTLFKKRKALNIDYNQQAKRVKK